jgi:hypothetical protein
MWQAGLFVFMLAVGTAQAQQATTPAPPASPPSSTGDLGAGRDLGTGGGVTPGSGNIGGSGVTGDTGPDRDLGTGGGVTPGSGFGGSGVTGDTGPDRDLGTGGTGMLDEDNRLGTGGSITGDTQTPTAIEGSAFLRLDTNRNGAIDRAEAELDSTLADGFAAADGDRDGSLSLSEFQAMRRQR